MLVRSLPRLLLGLLAAAVALTACAGDDGGALRAEDARARAQVASAGPSAIYLQLTNDSDADAELVAVSVPAEVAGYTELHETVPVEDDEMSEGEMPDDEMSEGGMSEGEMSEGMGGMRMQQVSGVPVPAGDSVSLEPGGLHIMLMELPDDLQDGETFEATLEFADGSTTSVTVEVTTNP